MFHRHALLFPIARDIQQVGVGVGLPLSPRFYSFLCFNGLIMTKKCYVSMVIQLFQHVFLNQFKFLIHILKCEILMHVIRMNILN